MIARLAGLAFAFATLLASPARADFADSLFDKLETLPTGINRDQIEMARYAIRYPANAEVVFARAAEQDYPFFALVGAVKLVKNKNLPEIGTFTEAKCTFPITAIDAVFAKASGTIDNAQGKKDTDQALELAKSYAGDYVKAQTDNAKQQAISELTQNIPYFKDIRVICNFAFQSNFSTERNIQTFVGQVAQDLRQSYNGFKKGDISTGVQHLVAAGVSSGLVCTIIDDAASGGLIGDTPVLGDLANGLCKSFAGTVIKGIQSVAKAAACFVEALWGGCDKATPPPPTGISEASKFCAPYGGLQAAMSRTNQPNDYSVICNDGSKCIVEPGKKPRCATGAQIALHQAEMINRAAIDYKLGTIDWSHEFDEKWTNHCPDPKCKTTMSIIRTAALEDAKKQHEANPTNPWPMIAFFVSSKSDKEAKTAIADAEKRVAILNDPNAPPPARLGAMGCVSLVGRANQYICNEAQGWRECVSYVKSQKAQVCMSSLMGPYADAANTASILKLQGCVQQGNTGLVFKCAPDQPTSMVMCEKFASNGVAVTCSAMNLSDSTVSPAVRLHSMGCESLLGRANEYICNDDQAWQQCVSYVKVDKAQVCMSAKLGPYADAAHTVSILKLQGCAQQGNTGLVFNCAPDKPNSMADCTKFKANGEAVVCNVASLSPAATLAGMGCKSFLGRTNQYLCEDDKAWQACVSYVKADKAEVCMSAKFGPYADAAHTVSILGGQGCAQQGNTGLVFNCAPDKPNGMAECTKFKANGEAVVCNVASLSPAASLAAMGCKSFLGRANQYLCEDDKAWHACVSYVKADKAEVCMSAKFGPYADAAHTVSILSGQGCTRQGTIGLLFKCAPDKPNGKAECNKFKANGEAVTCN